MEGEGTGVWGIGVHNESPQDVHLYDADYFELKANETLKTPEKFYPPVTYLEVELRALPIISYMAGQTTNYWTSLFMSCNDLLKPKAPYLTLNSEHCVYIILTFCSWDSRVLGSFSYMWVPICTYVLNLVFSCLSVSCIYNIIRPAQRGKFLPQWQGISSSMWRSNQKLGISRSLKGWRVPQGGGKMVWRSQRNPKRIINQKTTRFYIAWHICSDPHCALLRIIAE